MVGAALDWLFDVVVERSVLSLGALLIWRLGPRRRTFTEQMERTVPNLVAGGLVWAALIAVVLVVF